KERAFHERNDAHQPGGVRLVGGGDAPIVGAAKHGGLALRRGEQMFMRGGGAVEAQCARHCLKAFRSFPPEQGPGAWPWVPAFAGMSGVLVWGRLTLS